jgi:hypothetical protein
MRYMPAYLKEFECPGRVIFPRSGPYQRMSGVRGKSTVTGSKV